MRSNASARHFFANTKPDIVLGEVYFTWHGGYCVDCVILIPLPLIAASITKGKTSNLMQLNGPLD